ncbi:hypothetical protein [Paenibacillus arenilitoris]|uniref:Uncharacterized protein n=1 Tax=Paenibacillus arenilitoris TaxID=2772299 RepID=A0A927CJT0_9BACL|nr:hypothetical protein [Paenibacillus arenilitoris]MBD2868027.1 hypothetical protein [Paenibacillus arenilitoris]
MVMFKPILIGIMLSGVIGTHPAPEVDLRNVNGITLYDDAGDIVRKQGKPANVAKDPYLAESEIYDYPDMRIGLRGGIVDFVEIPGGAASLTIDGETVPPSAQALRELLGEPDYKAEDGIVFQRKEALLKLFIDNETQTLERIRYYHLASV